MARRQRDQWLAPAGEERIGPRRRAHRRAVRASVAKAGSRSRSVRALSTMMSCPMLRAAACSVPCCGHSVAVARIDAATATRGVAGDHSRSSPNRLRQARRNTVTPVRLPPGRLRLATRPRATGSFPWRRRSARSRLAALCGALRRSAAPTRRRPPGVQQARLPAPETIELTVRPAVFDRDVSTFDKAAFRSDPGGTPPASIRRRRVDLPLRNPITGIAGCCARAASGHAAAAPPSSVMNSRRFTAQYLPCFRPKEIAHLGTAGGCCAAGFQSSLCRRWVNRVVTGRERPSIYFRNAPKADAKAGHRHLSRRASCGQSLSILRRSSGETHSPIMPRRATQHTAPPTTPGRARRPADSRIGSAACAVRTAFRRESDARAS